MGHPLYSCVVLCLLFSTVLAYRQEISTAPPQPMTTTMPPITTTTTATQSTTNKVNDENEKINLKIAHILEISKIGNIVGNTEYDRETAHLQHIASLGPESLQLKIRAYGMFLSYNYLRLELESNLLSRISVVESYLLDNRLSKKCKKFYRMQRRELKAALNQPNSIKSYKLKIYSKECRRSDKDESHEEDYHDWLDWLHWFPFINII